MVDTYLDDLSCVNKGSTVRDVDGCWPEVCSSLPLFDDECYLTANPSSSFLETLVAGSGLPFAKQIVDAKRKYDNKVAELGDAAEGAYNYLLPDVVSPGQCFAFSNEAGKEMIGFSEKPGFPPPLVYELCNCASMKLTGIPACAVQVCIPCASLMMST